MIRVSVILVESDQICYFSTQHWQFRVGNDGGAVQSYNRESKLCQNLTGVL